MNLIDKSTDQQLPNVLHDNGPGSHIYSSQAITREPEQKQCTTIDNSNVLMDDSNQMIIPNPSSTAREMGR
mgnify:FL=1